MFFNVLIGSILAAVIMVWDLRTGALHKDPKNTRWLARAFYILLVVNLIWINWHLYDAWMTKR